MFILYIVVCSNLRRWIFIERLGERNSISFFIMALVALMPMIEQQLKEKNIAIILGDTGMGKSTVVPQELLKIFPKKTVMMVEKRRVAARELSKFMSAPRNG